MVGDFVVYSENGAGPITTPTSIDNLSPSTHFKLDVVYPLTAPPNATGTVLVKWGNGNSAEITITGNRLAAGTTPAEICLSVDKSGSMGAPSGIPGQTRLDVLDWSSRVFIDLVDAGSSIGINSFDGTAHELTAITEISTNSPAEAQDDRDAVKGGLDGLQANGSTSIGAGLEDAQSKLGSEASAIVEWINERPDLTEAEVEQQAESLEDLLGGKDGEK